jgi:hypothetical protein
MIISIEETHLDNHFRNYIKREELDKYKNVGYKFLHLGCVQVGISYVVSCLMESRHNDDVSDSLF